MSAKRYHDVSAAFTDKDLGDSVHEIFKQAGGKLMLDGNLRL
jgi:hypothetical protein